MKKFLATIAVALALCAPAAAAPQQMTAESIHQVILVLIGYNLFCDRLGPVNTELMDLLTSTISRKEEIAAAAYNQGIEIKQEGIGHWCARTVAALQPLAAAMRCDSHTDKALAT